jgi:outer membrane protein assembly factor BamB
MSGLVVLFFLIMPAMLATSTGARKQVETPARHVITGPYVDAGSPDPAWTRDGAFSIAGDSVVRHAGQGHVIWATQLEGDLGGVRPPHLIADAHRVYVANGGGVTALDVDTGRLAWNSNGPNERMLLSKDLILATECGTGGAIKANGRYATARKVTDGSIAFKLRLPDAWEDPLPICEVAGLFVIQDYRSRATSDGALLVDHSGRVRFRLRRLVTDGIRLGDDMVLLLNGEVVRLAPSGEARWSFPSHIRGDDERGSGGIVALPGGDLLEYEFDDISDSGVALKRFEPSVGKMRWDTFCEPLGVAHSIYHHDAHVVIEAGQVKVISRGSAGTFTEWLAPSTGHQVRRVVGNSR